MKNKLNIFFRLFLLIFITVKVISSESVPLGDLEPDLSELYDTFTKGKPSSYDFTLSDISGYDLDSAQWCINNISNLYYSVRDSGYDEDAFSNHIKDMYSYLLPIAAKEKGRMIKFRNSKEFKETMKRDGQVLGPSKSVSTGVSRIRKLDDNYLFDMSSDLYVTDMEDPDLFEWVRSESYFKDTDGKYKLWYKFYDSKRISLKPSSDTRSFRFWEAYYMDEKTKETLVSFARDFNVSLFDMLGTEITDESNVPLSEEKIKSLTDGTHEKIIVKAIKNNSGSDYVFLDFISRNSPNHILLSMLCKTDNITKPLIVIRRDADSSVNHCSFRKYHENGDLHLYGYFTKRYITKPFSFKKEDNGITFRLMEFFTTLNHSDPQYDIFTLKVPKGWDFGDFTEVIDGYAKLYKSDGTTNKIMIGRPKANFPGANAPSPVKLPVYKHVLLLLCFVFLLWSVTKRKTKQQFSLKAISL